MTDKLAALKKLREPFLPHQISKLPKPTKAQTEAVQADFRSGIRCELCGAWHHPDVVHLDYVGHAALTDRLLDTDPEYVCKPMAKDDFGLPLFDKTGGLWVELTVAGVTRMGYGNAVAKPNQEAGNREKEVIGDAMRNAAMRFGAALDLWHKGDLHMDDDDGNAATAQTVKKPAQPEHITDEQRDALALLIDSLQHNIADICQGMKVKSLTNIRAVNFEKAKDFIENFGKKDEKA